MDLGKGIGRYLGGEVPRGTPDAVDVQTEVQKGRHYGLSVEAHAYSGLVRRAFAADDVQDVVVAVLVKLVPGVIE